MFPFNYSKHSFPFAIAAKKQPASGCAAESESRVDNKPLPIVSACLLGRIVRNKGVTNALYEICLM